MESSEDGVPKTPQLHLEPVEGNWRPRRVPLSVTVEREDVEDGTNRLGIYSGQARLSPLPTLYWRMREDRETDELLRSGKG